MPVSGAHLQTGARLWRPAGCLQRGGQVPGRAVSAHAAGWGQPGGQLAHRGRAVVVAHGLAPQATKALFIAWERVLALQVQAAMCTVMEGRP